MSASTAIGMVSASLRALLHGEMKLQPQVPVTVLAPDEQGADRRVNLFLYKVDENPFLKNADWTLVPGTPNHAVDAPLSLKLTYLLTSYAPNDDVTGNAAAHQILGEAMRVLHDNSPVPPGYLDAGLADAREQLQIAGGTLGPDELNGLWTTFSRPYRVSVSYQVSTVQLDRLPESGVPVAPRVHRTGGPGISTAVTPPVVTGMAPVDGPAGTAVTFTGNFLTGRHAAVRCGGRTVVEDLSLTDDTFTAHLPGDLGPGVYEVTVDVSRLFRRTFLFEVTP